MSHQGLLLSGLDGSNPLGFLAAVGTLVILSDQHQFPDKVAKLGWRETPEGWRAVLVGWGDDESRICETTVQLLAAMSDDILNIGNYTNPVVGKKKKPAEMKKFPFSACRFASVLRDAADTCTGRSREVDLLASFGTEVYPDGRTGDFQCTRFKLVRNGDSQPPRDAALRQEEPTESK